MRFMKSIGSSSTKNDYYKEGELRIYNKNNKSYANVMLALDLKFFVGIHFVV